MEIKSLGCRTDLIFHKFDGEVIDRGNYVVAKIPATPNYFWGNLLLFNRPPRKGDLAAWKRLFLTEFTDPSMYHITLTWDAPDGEVGDPSEFVAEGFELDGGIILTASSVQKPPKHNIEIQVRPIQGEEEWEAATRVQTESAQDGSQDLSIAQWTKFYAGQMKRYRQMVLVGHGHWFGAFLNGKIVGGLGLFRDGDIGRYQIVTTHVAYRRLGICGTLVYESAKYAFRNMGIKTLVMSADEEYHAAKIYESVGFRPTEKQIGMCWWDRSKPNL